VLAGLTRGDAMKAEAALISQFGRRADGGSLLNVSFGGGAPAPETIARIAAKKRGQ